MKSLYLHRFIMESSDNIYIDHKNHDTLDNRKCNLRVTTNDKNTKNKNGKNKNNTSGYRNVSLDKRTNKWMVQLQINGKNTKLKTFSYNQLDEAGAFAELMRKKYYGEFAGNN